MKMINKYLKLIIIGMFVLSIFPITIMANTENSNEGCQEVYQVGFKKERDRGISLKLPLQIVKGCYFTEPLHSEAELYSFELLGEYNKIINLRKFQFPGIFFVESNNFLRENSEGKNFRELKISPYFYKEVILPYNKKGKKICIYEINEQSKKPVFALDVTQSNNFGAELDASVCQRRNSLAAPEFPLFAVPFIIIIGILGFLFVRKKTK